MRTVEIRYLGNGNSLDTARRARLAAELAAAMPRHEVDHYLRAKPAILAESDHIAVAEARGACVGLMAANRLSADGLDFTYIETLLVGERLHGSGVALGLVASLFAGVVRELDDFPDLVAMKTYTPKAYLLMRRFALGGDIVFYPSLDGPVDAGIPARLARALSPGCEFRAGTGVVHGGGGRISSRFWRDAPLSGDTAVDGFFAREVGERDRLLCVVHAPTPAAKGALMAALRISQPIRTD
ncbi:hypothetical protein FHS29_003746 [Saccharothrix tamanrassetensis]|uniref:N-acetyltransferase domain-containing protein n=1 Tax=Saccharothrix tamanrassetensis TaxID=1051531 RepID=A0A841CJK1_9PSEU|nr:hypothetical protein [Saccharothrix tamanrassetensis]MBB5957153.1 hypothetical protein [Saccharothrix tamanrassetensis]